MTDLIAMAKQTGAATYTNRHYPERTVCAFGPEKLQAFADLIRADEREACAKVCDSMLDWADHYVCAVAIRARTT